MERLVMTDGEWAIFEVNRNGRFSYVLTRNGETVMSYWRKSDAKRGMKRKMEKELA